MVRDGVPTLRRPGRIGSPDSVFLIPLVGSRESLVAFSFFVSGR